MCQVLQVSRRGYYDWAGREESTRSQQDRVLLKEIRKIHQESKEAYGATKTWQSLKQGGWYWQASSGPARASGRDRIASQARIQTGLSGPQHGPCGSESFTLAVQGRFPRSDLSD